ncbi:nucleotide-diphospho-sugar transferase [Pelagophyceae sp. CCMP2097]|nr:nucleotide-diphospho-sugar transferase [Pelagophyceae sp. CCMP2097]
MSTVGNVAVAAVEVALAVAVQGGMLLQVGLSYAFLRFQWRNRPMPYAVPGVDELGPESLLTVVIPAYRERASIEQTLRRLSLAAERPDLIEVIVVDAGGGDGTMELAAEVAKDVVGGKRGLRAVRCDVASTGGRGPAVAAGCRAAVGDILMVVHADTAVPLAYDARCRAALADPFALATAFRFGVERESILAEAPGAPVLNLLRAIPFRIMEATVHVRSTLLQLPFGDQAFGGLDDPLASVPILEDFLLVQRLRRLGATGAGRIVILGSSPALCSARRWRKSSVWRVNLTNQAVMLLHTYAGYTPHDIFELYYGAKVAP